MILSVCVDVLRLRQRIAQKRHRRDKLLAVFEYLHHRPSLPVKRQPRMHLHFSCNPRVVPLLKEYPALIRNLVYRRKPLASVPHGRVRYAVYLDARLPFRLHAFVYPLPDLFQRFFRSHVPLPAPSVYLLVSVYLSPVSYRPAPQRPRMRESVIQRYISRPPFRYLKRLYHVRPFPVQVMLRLVRPFREYLPFECVPVPVQQRVS